MKSSSKINNSLSVIIFVFRFDILGNEDNFGQSQNIPIISLTLFIFQSYISVNEDNFEQP